jgi:hypothetical protein
LTFADPSPDWIAAAFIACKNAGFACRSKMQEFNATINQNIGYDICIQ